MANQYFGTDYTEPKSSISSAAPARAARTCNTGKSGSTRCYYMENQQPFIDEVVPHELAHLSGLPPVWPRTGPTWQRVAMDDGACAWRQRQPHAQIRSGVRTEKNLSPIYAPVSDHHLTVRRHNKVMRKESEYRCVIAASCYISMLKAPLMAKNINHINSI